MKGGVLALRGTKLSLILVTLVCTTLALWAWDKAPFVVSLLPQKFRVSSDNFIGSPVTKNASEQVFGSDSRSDSAKRDGKSSSGENGNGFDRKEVGTFVQMGSANTSTVVTRNEKGNFTYQGNKQTCNYAKGKWVANDTRPFYTGGRCLQWLSEMWACRLTNRIDFAYEKFRWQPSDCEMSEFSGSKFLRRMRNKTLAFIGDSLGRQQFQSLMCMITGGKTRTDVLDVGSEYGLVKAPGAKRPDGWAYRFPKTNTTILFYWSACLCDLEKLNPSSGPEAEVAMHLDRPPSFLTRYLDRFDVVVLNTGHHWNRGKLDANHWVIHVGGKPSNDMKMEEAKSFAIRNIVKWVDSQLPVYPRLRAFYRTISPRHFNNGDWDTGGSCNNTVPLLRGGEVVKEESSDPVAAMAVEGTGVKLLDITALSELRDEGHISMYRIRALPGGGQDCLHWCLPGIPDAWNEILFAQL